MEEEVFVLTEEQKKEFEERFDSGDIGGLTYLADIIHKSKNSTEELRDLVDCVIHLNYMNDICETIGYDSFDRWQSTIEVLYGGLKHELFDMTSLYKEEE